MTRNEAIHEMKNIAAIERAVRSHKDIDIVKHCTQVIICRTNCLLDSLLKYVPKEEEIKC